ncbi:MAG: biotin synthase BioB [Nitrospirae bacterium]|nr:biotin synthase BioB [Nitrospirota bacterium]
MRFELMQSIAEAQSLLSLPDEELFALADAAREKRSGRTADICSIINAKSGACPEDCSFCAQSARNRASSQIYPLVDDAVIRNAARSARENGARRFCIVTSGRGTAGSDLERIERMIGIVADEGLMPCATLGIMNVENLRRLKQAGLHRYHHNLETSEAFFSEICRTHTYQEKIVTIRAALDSGLSVCSGGIFGLGETWRDRVEMAFAIKELGVDAVPVNFLMPVAGTPLGSRPVIEPLEALRIIAVYRLILPDREIRVCGGRLALGGRIAEMFRAGADGFLIGNYLTTTGRDPSADSTMLREAGFEAIP